MKKRIFLIVCIIVAYQGYSQRLDYADVSKEELQELRDVDFPDASAKVIFRKVEVSFGEEVYVYDRVKIYNRDGFEYAKWVINFDRVESLRARTYNLENGEIVVSKAGKESIFKEDIGNGEKINKVAFPNVKEGSVLDIRYRIKDIGVNAIYTQADIPVKDVLIIVSNPYLKELKITQNPLSNVSLTSSKKKEVIRFKGKNIPPLEVERFMPSYHGYRGTLHIEQVTVYGKEKLNEWKDVAKFYNKASWFGRQLKKKPFFKDDLTANVKTDLSPLQQAKSIYYYLQDRMQYNNQYSRGDENIQKAYEGKIGSVGAVNLILIKMLREQGFDANPFLIASKEEGYILYPTVAGFNNVIVSVAIDGKDYFLDASNKNAAFGQLNTSFNNGDGLIVYANNNSKRKNTAPLDLSREIFFANATVNAKSLEVLGEVKNKKEGYFSLSFRELYRDANENAYWNYLQSEWNQLLIKDMNIESLVDVEKPIVLSYAFNRADGVEKIGENLYISPLGHFGLKENEFKKDNRVYPIDFSYPKAKTITINYKIPEGYNVESVPENISIATKDQVGSLIFSTTTVGNILQVTLKFNLNYTIVGPTYYEGIKALYSSYYKLSQSKIVFTKN